MPVGRRIDCGCHGCKRKQPPLRLVWGTTIHRCESMTVGKGETNRYVVIDPGSTQFESRNPGALFVAFSRAKAAGGPEEYPDFAWNPHVLVNEDRLCHRVDTPTTRELNQELARLEFLSERQRQCSRCLPVMMFSRQLWQHLKHPLLRNKQSQICCSSRYFCQLHSKHLQLT